MDALEMAGAIGAVGGAVVLLSGGGRWAWRTGRRLHDVHTALLGEPARTVAGVTLPAVPGIGERLGRVEAEFQPNHGASLRDAVDRLQRTVEAHVAAPADQAHPSPIAAGQSTG